MSVLDNVKTGLHNKHEYSIPIGRYPPPTPAYQKMEKQMNEQAMELLQRVRTGRGG